MSQKEQFVYDEDYFLSNDLCKLNEKLKEAILYLKEMVKQPSKIFTDPNGYEALYLIAQIIYNLNFDFSIFVFNEFEKIASNLFVYLYEIRDELNFEESEPYNELNAKGVQAFVNLLYISNKIQSRSMEYCVKFVLNRGLRAYVLFLSDETFKAKNNNVKVCDISGEKKDLLEYLIDNVCTLKVTCCEMVRYKWHEFDTAEILFKLSKLKKAKLFDINCLITYIVDDIQIECFSGINSIIQNMKAYLLKFEKDFQSNNFARITAKIKMNSQLLNCQVHRIYDEETKASIPLNGLLNSFYKLSVNPQIKTKIYFENEMKSFLQTFLNKGNPFEIYSSLTLLAQFSFSDEIKNDINDSLEMLSVLDELASKDLSKIKDIDEKAVYSSVKKLAEIIKWNLKMDEEIAYREEITRSGGEHVMISYSTENTVLCLKIRDKIESFGHKVWMDLNDIHGSSLDVITRGIEQSYCVLMCITEKYRQSISCQFECQYAFNMKKNILPLVTQSEYELKGWMEIVVGNKKSVNFTEYEFGQCMQRIKHEIDILFPKVKIISEINKAINLNTITIRTPEKWSELEVKDWFVKNNINLNIFDYFRPLTGKILFQLYEMNKKTPEYYNQSLKEIKNIKFNMIVTFTACLNELFRRKN